MLGARSIAVVSMLGSLLACSASGTQTSSGEEASSGAPPASSTSATTPTSDAGVPPEASVPGDFAKVTLDGQPVAATLRACGDFEDSTYRSMEVDVALPGERSLHLTYMFGYAGRGGHAPTGKTPFPKQGDVLIQITLSGPGDDGSSPDKMQYSGKGTLDLIATGATGRYEGTAEGELTKPADVFTGSPDVPSIKFQLAWRKD